MTLQTQLIQNIMKQIPKILIYNIKGIVVVEKMGLEPTTS